METVKKYWPFAVILLLVACVGWLFPSWRKEVEKNKSLSKTITWQDKQLKTKVKEKVIRIPVEVAGKIVYRTERVTDRDTSENTHAGTDTVVATSTEKSVETKRGQFEIGFGINPLKLDDIGVYMGVNGVLGPLGAWGYTTLSYHAIGAKIGL